MFTLGSGRAREQETLEEDERKRKEITFWKQELEEAVEEKNFYKTRFMQTLKENVRLKQHLPQTDSPSSSPAVDSSVLDDRIAVALRNHHSVSSTEPSPLSISSEGPGSSRLDQLMVPDGGQWTLEQALTNMAILRTQCGSFQKANFILNKQNHLLRSSEVAFQRDTRLLKEELRNQRGINECTADETTKLLSDIIKLQQQNAAYQAELAHKAGMVELLQEQLRELTGNPEALKEIMRRSYECRRSAVELLSDEAGIMAEHRTDIPVVTPLEANHTMFEHYSNGPGPKALPTQQSKAAKDSKACVEAEGHVEAQSSELVQEQQTSKEVVPSKDQPDEEGVKGDVVLNCVRESAVKKEQQDTSEARLRNIYARIAAISTPPTVPPPSKTPNTHEDVAKDALDLSATRSLGELDDINAACPGDGVGADPAWVNNEAFEAEPLGGKNLYNEADYKSKLPSLQFDCAIKASKKARSAVVVLLDPHEEDFIKTSLAVADEEENLSQARREEACSDAASAEELKALPKTPPHAKSNDITSVKSLSVRTKKKPSSVEGAGQASSVASSDATSDDATPVKDVSLRKSASAATKSLNTPPTAPKRRPMAKRDLFEFNLKSQSPSGRSRNKSADKTTIQARVGNSKSKVAAMRAAFEKK